MSVALVTGSSGLIGSETVRFFHKEGFDVVGIDNHMREYFFGAGASVAANTARLQKDLKRFTANNLDIRDEEGIAKIFRELGKNLAAVIHTAAQPSHDWAAREPFTDFSVNATGTLVLLENMRQHCPDSVFIFTSTNKVYGDLVNQLPLNEEELRWELDAKHPYFEFGIDERMSIDQSKHSLFGASKIAADILTQEYGRYFGLKTGTFRGGCLTGPAHSGAELHGFLSYLAKCVVSGKPYTIYGHKGKQVRDNIHSFDLVSAFWEFFQAPKPGAVYNLGGSRHSHCSVLEAIDQLEGLCKTKLKVTIDDTARAGDHQWWISDVRRFQSDYPNWNYKYDLDAILQEIVASLEVD